MHCSFLAVSFPHSFFLLGVHVFLHSCSVISFLHHLLQWPMFSTYHTLISLHSYLLAVSFPHSLLPVRCCLRLPSLLFYNLLPSPSAPIVSALYYYTFIFFHPILLAVSPPSHSVLPVLCCLRQGLCLPSPPAPMCPLLLHIQTYIPLFLAVSSPLTPSLSPSLCVVCLSFPHSSSLSFIFLSFSGQSSPLSSSYPFMSCQALLLEVIPSTKGSQRHRFSHTHSMVGEDS